MASIVADEPARLNPSQIGATAELAVASALISSGRDVFVPLLNSHSRVDLVFENDSGLFKVQCKSSCLKNEVIVFRTCSNTANIPKDYLGQIDFFGVYSPELDQVFLVPIDHVATRICHLRLGPTRNGQIARTRLASDYLVSP